MASTYSTNLGIELIGTGDQSGTWGATTNTNLGTLLEQAIVGYATQAVTDSASPTVLAITNGASSTGRNYVITLTGALTANRTVEVPAVNKPYTFFNNTTGGFSVTVKVTGQTGVTIANGKKAIVYTNSTDVIEVANAPVTEAGTQTLTNKTLTDPLISTVAGGTTASSTLTLESTTGAGTSDSILFKTGSQSTRMTIDTSGNVSVASGNLTFAGTGQRITGDFSNATATSRVGFQTSTTNGNTGVPFIPNGTATGAVARFFASSSITNASNMTIGADGTGGRAYIESQITGTGTYLPITFGVSGSEAMRIATNGNVGIGTISPGNYLTVCGAGTYQIRVISTAGGTEYYDFGRDPADGLFAINGAQTTLVGYKWKINGTEAMRIDSSGNVGIGVVPYATGLQLYRNTTGLLFSDIQNPSTTNASDGVVQRFVTSNVAGSGTTSADIVKYKSGAFSIKNNETNSAAYMSFEVGTVERMRIDSSGNVGIGTSSPVAQLGLYGAGQTTGNMSTATGLGGTIFLRDSDGASGNGGAVVFGALQGAFAAIKGFITDGSNNTVGALVFSNRANSTDSTLTERMRIDSSGNVIAGGSAALATTATNGFLYVPTCAGTPTGTPTAVTGMAPIVVNTTNNKLYFYSGGAWRDAGP